jgi:hypothetical protein
MRWGIAVVLLAVLLGQRCGAQERVLAQPRLGVLSPPRYVSPAQATSECPPSAGATRDQLEAEIPKDSVIVTCAVERIDTLGRADSADWWAVQYLTRYVYSADTVKRRLAPRDIADTTDVIDIVLYAADRDGAAWRAEWQAWADRRLTRDLRITVARHAGFALFSVLSCVNGTGGCEQHFVARQSASWVTVNDRYTPRLARQFGVNAFWKGIAVDVQTLRGTVPLYSEGDANCCPSRLLRLRLAVHGTDIVVSTATPIRNDDAARR